MLRKLSAPIGVELKLTNACNLSCRHCLAESGSRSAHELSFDEIKAIIDELARLNVFYLGLTGGEPMMASSLLDVLDYAQEKGLKTGLTTNGTKITKSNARRLLDSGCSLYRVSLDGADAATHDSFRGQAGAFDRTLEGIHHLMNAGASITLLTVISKRNLHNWEEILELAKREGIPSVNAYVFVPEGRGVSHREEALSPEEYRDFLNRVLELQSKPDTVQLLTENPLLAVVRDSRAAGSCPAGTVELFVKENGDVTPCPYFPNVIGNIREKSIAEIWQSPFLDDLRDSSMLGPECRSCEYGEACFGGCRAAAYCEHGTISSVDPFCWHASGRS